jgi:hypothetical protein
LHITTAPSTLTATSGFGAHAIYLVAAIPLVVAIVVAILVWRNALRERTSRTLWTNLANPDPTARRAALDGLADDAIDYNAPLLCELLKFEHDPDVLDALAAAVARSKWEPTTDPSLLELRRWVAGGQARATGSSRAPGPVDEVRVPPGFEPAAASGVATIAAPRPASTPLDEDVPIVTSTTPGIEGLTDLVPNVRRVLGEDLTRLELVSIDGELLASWSAETDRAANDG